MFAGLFAGLLDDAAMFPPGNAGAEQALRAHLRYRSAWFAPLVGPLLVATDRWTELVAAHGLAGSPQLDVVVIGSAQRPEPLPERLGLVGFELAVRRPPLPDSEVPVACEITATAAGWEVLDQIARQHALGRAVIAKYRTGGTSANAFPGEQQVATVIRFAVDAGAPLKFTAGLHRAARFTDPVTGFEHHGFLNLMAAVSRAQHGAELDDVTSVLAERDPQRVATEVGSWSVDQVAAVRRTFVSFGCCGVQEPIADLVALGLLRREA